jgi:putative transcriptional regulator
MRSLAFGRAPYVGTTSILVSAPDADAALRKTVPPPEAARMIRAWRHRTGLTQEGLARALGVTFSTVSRWENGHVRPSSLAWKALVQLAAERGTLLVDERESVLSE